MTKQSTFRFKLKFEDRLIMDEKADRFEDIEKSIRSIKKKFI